VFKLVKSQPCLLDQIRFPLDTGSVGRKRGYEQRHDADEKRKSESKEEKKICVTKDISSRRHVRRAVTSVGWNGFP